LLVYSLKNINSRRKSGKRLAKIRHPGSTQSLDYLWYKSWTAL